MSNPTARVAIGTATTAVCGCHPAVQKTAISRALRQCRQLRQGCLISCEEILVTRVNRQINMRQLRETLPTLPALPFCSNIRGLRTAGCSRPPAKAAVDRAVPRRRLAWLPQRLAQITSQQVNFTHGVARVPPCGRHLCLFLRHLRVDMDEALRFTCGVGKVTSGGPDVVS
jgi:hypothetical protein